MSPPTRFGEKYLDELKQSRQIDCFYNASVVDIKMYDDRAGVKHVLVRNYNNQTFALSANNFVLAFGALENARALLNANSQAKDGIGNHSDMVGRCFMESLNVPIGRFLVTDPSFWKQYDNIHLIPTEELIRKEKIGNGVIDFSANAPDGLLRTYGRLHVLKQFIRDTGCRSPSLTSLARHIVDFDCPGDGIIRSLIEQEPNPDSRVSLTEEVDAFGRRRLQLNWQLSESDHRTIRFLSIELAKEMAKLNVARVQLAPFILNHDLEIEGISGHGHHMGTTRMSKDPRYGVVDHNCKVHGIQNLYVIGSSVYPNCGARNPTLTVILLSLRLGKYLGDAS